jgi:hypothetical protein
VGIGPYRRHDHAIKRPGMEARPYCFDRFFVIRVI